MKTQPLGLNRKRDLAEMLLARLMRKRVSDLIEREVLIQDRLDVARFDCRDHVFLMLSGSDGDARHGQIFREEGRRRHITRHTGEHPDE